VVEELILDGPPFDVLQLKAQLIEKMGSSPNAQLMKMPGIRGGGLNAGMWILSDGSRKHVLKLVSSARRHPRCPSEAELFKAIAKDHPSVVKDHAIAFPVRIFHLCDAKGNKPYDLIAMRKAPGVCFDEVMARKWQGGKKAELFSDFEAFGCFLAALHKCYGMQHGDLHASNVYYEEQNGLFTLIDVAGMAPNPYGGSDNDVEHFIGSLKIISQRFGESLYSQGRRFFLTGYNKINNSS